MEAKWSQSRVLPSAELAYDACLSAGSIAMLAHGHFGSSLPWQTATLVYGCNADAHRADNASVRSLMAESARRGLLMASILAYP
jgi:hypothetical protein